MRAERLIATMGILSFLFGACSESQPLQLPTGPLPEITSTSEAGDEWYDLVFAIREHKRLADGSQELQAFGTYEGREVGLAVVLGPDWKRGTLDPKLPLAVHGGTVAYRSLGAPSDALLQALDQLYGTKLNPTAMRAQRKFDAISLDGEPADLAKGPIRLRLFFESEVEEIYLELFTNIDLASGTLSIGEKDPDYRSAVVRALRAE